MNKIAVKANMENSKNREKSVKDEKIAWFKEHDQTLQKFLTCAKNVRLVRKSQRLVMENSRNPL